MQCLTRSSHLFAVKAAILPCEALADDLRTLVHEYRWLMSLSDNSGRISASETELVKSDDMLQMPWALHHCEQD